MQTTLRNVTDARLQMAVIFMPVIAGDGRDASIELSKEFADSRVRYFWDSEGLAGILWQKTLGLNFFAWDIYLVYGAEASWEQEPAAPQFWMHQLRFDKAPRLNQEQFQLKILELLQKSPPIR